MGDIVRVVKNGKFIGWYIRYKDADGRRKQRATHQPTKADARRMLIEVEARIARGLFGVPQPAPIAEGTVAKLCDRYLCEFASPKIKDLEAYRRTTRVALNRLLPQLGRLAVATLKQEHIEDALRAVAGRYKPNSIRSSAGKLQAVLNWAVRKGLLLRSPAKGLDLPPRESSLEHLSPEEARRLLAELDRRAQGDRRALAWRSRFVAVSLALRLGLRRGEVFGLRWQDIDLHCHRLVVARSYSTLPKSNKARPLPIPADLAAVLRDWRERCPPTDEGLVCPVRYEGEWRMSSSRAQHGLPEALKAAGCRKLLRGFHSLRHTFASTFMMAGGNILTLQKILGHSDVKMTMIYSHLSPGYLEGELERIKY